MANGISGIDHAIIMTRDLEETRGLYGRLGFTLTPRGHHVGAPTGNYCIMFEDDYFELLGVIRETSPEDVTDFSIFEGEPGLSGVALSIPDIHETVRLLQDHGTAEGLEIKSVGRQIEGAGAHGRLAFKIATLPDGTAPGLWIMLCHHETPERLRRARWVEHRNGALGLDRITVVADRPDRLLPRYEALFGAGSSVVTDDTLAVFTGPHSIMAVTPAHLSVLFPDLGIEARETPYMAAMSIRVGSIKRAAKVLTDNGVPFAKTGDGAIHVGASETGGVILEFCCRADALAPTPFI